MGIMRAAAGEKYDPEENNDHVQSDKGVCDDLQVHHPAVS